MKATDIPTATRKVVHDRDQGCCRLCGQHELVELHHIVYRSQERNNHDPDNLVSLCRRCHRIAHTRPTAVRPALMAVIHQPWSTGLRWLRTNGHDIRGLSRGTL